MGLRGITVQVINPGFVLTPLTARHAARMPFLMPLDKAVRRICDGFERAGFEITFPRRLAHLVKTINLLPYGLYFKLTARFARPRAGSGTRT